MSEHTGSPWVCADCGKEHPFPSLARACESRHERDRLAAASARVLAVDGARPAVP
ncbi:hypothetical protein [uncultured Cellulomonas sp.]|uniref:hypothetical protein n=1 Tax=uncultured Cellulomonas sp. TaxID=189682 RepID=UPI0028E3CC60|nr:hypothetical protein [uncultured Cellulomonas sp.]